MAADKWNKLSLPTRPWLGSMKGAHGEPELRSTYGGMDTTWVFMNLLGCCTCTRSLCLHLLMHGVMVDVHRNAKYGSGCLTFYEAVVGCRNALLNQKASLQRGFIIAFPQAGHIWAPIDLFEMLSFIGKIRSITVLGSLHIKHNYCDFLKTDAPC